MSQPFTPSSPIDDILTEVAALPSGAAGMRAIMQRANEFANPLQANLTGIALDPYRREVAEQTLDGYWSDEQRRQDTLENSNAEREVIIGSGFHAAVYAAVRVLAGHPKPLVLERGSRAGGTFAMTTWPAFYLNSRNRPGRAGLAGDQGASLNYLPGAPIQAAHVSMAQYQANTDMALVIRLALAQFAEVVTDARVVAVSGDEDSVTIVLNEREPLSAGRVIDARGVGDPCDGDAANGATICTFPQFMQRMAQPWPLRGLRRVAVIGGGDSAKCTVESLLGIAPAPPMAAAALDNVERIDWYCENLPSTCDGWQDEIRGRYQAIGRYLRPDRFGVQRLTVLQRRARPVALPADALIEGRTYDLAVMCTGNQEALIDGLELGSFNRYTIADEAVARRHFDMPVYRVGPHAKLSLTAREFADSIGDIPGNAVAMFRTVSKTAALAATLTTTG
jgi:hypothetical protein